MHIRPARPETDDARIVALINDVESRPITLAEFRHWDQQMPPERIYRRMVATDDRDEVIGSSVVNHHTWSPPRHFYVWIIVDRQWRSRGIGSALYADAKAFIRSCDRATLDSEVRDDCAASLSFALRRGFSIDRHIFESTLDLTTFDEKPYLAGLSAATAIGIRLFSLADMGDTREARRRLYDVNRATALDIPGADGTFMSFEEFEQWVCKADWFRPAGQLIAAVGETWVGLGAVQLLPQDQGAYNLMTGVLAPYRGHKVALALKLAAIRYAREHGARYLRTHNDSLNAPMLAINHTLGYQAQPGKYILRRTCEGQ